MIVKNISKSKWKNDDDKNHGSNCDDNDNNANANDNNTNATTTINNNLKKSVNQLWLHIICGKWLKSNNQRTQGKM